MLSMNIVGRISREIRTNILPNGNKVANVPVAINLVNAAGKQSDKTLFAEIACWGDLADKVQNAVAEKQNEIKNKQAKEDETIDKKMKNELEKGQNKESFIDYMHNKK